MKSNIKILVADDNKNYLNAFQYILLNSFTNNIESVHLSRNNGECLDVLSHCNIDVCFIDVGTSSEKSIELTRSITERFKGVVVIALAFHKELITINKMIDAGARLLLLKEDINQNVLEKIFEKYLD
jgi:DNA-binding NarL/FixJ family response regulator